MFRKGLAVAVILLFIGVAVAPSINADIESIKNESVNFTHLIFNKKYKYYCLRSIENL